MCNNNMVYLNLRAFIMSKTSFALMVMVLMCLYILPIMSLFWQVDMIYMHFIAVYAISQKFTICPKHVLGIIKLMFIGYEMFFVMLCARLYFSPYHVCVILEIRILCMKHKESHKLASYLIMIMVCYTFIKT